MDNMQIYNAVKTAPGNALKEITAGRLRGKTDINPMWRIQTLTELFGACGIGWYYEIARQWTELGANGEVAAFCNINLYIKVGDEWSKPIQGTGGASFVANEKNGAYTSDECFKMSLTDAISVACKALGFAADVYWNTGGGSKYATSKPKEPEQPKTISDVTIKVIKGLIKELGIKETSVTQAYGIKSFREFTREQAQDCIEKLKARKNEANNVQA